MRKFGILMFILLALVTFNVSSCSQSSNKTQTSAVYTGEAPEVVLKDYHAYVQKFDSAGIANMRPDFGNLEQSKQDYKVIKAILKEGTALQKRMNKIANAENPQINLQIKPYMPIINARIMTLRQNVSTYQSMGVNQ